MRIRGTLASWLVRSTVQVRALPVLCSWARHYTLTCTVSTQYLPRCTIKWVPANLMLGVPLRLRGISSKSLHATETGITVLGLLATWLVLRLHHYPRQDNIVLAIAPLAKRIVHEYIFNAILTFEFIVPGKRTACAVIRSDVKRFYNWNLKQCEIECCTDNNCNNHIPMFISKGNEKKCCYLRKGF